MCSAIAGINCNQSQHFQNNYQLRHIGKAYLVSLAIGMVYLFSLDGMFGIWDDVFGIVAFSKI